MLVGFGVCKINLDLVVECNRDRGAGALMFEYGGANSFVRQDEVCFCCWCSVRMLEGFYKLKRQSIVERRSIMDAWGRG